MANRTKCFTVFFALLVLLAASSCLPQPPAETGGINITLYDFSGHERVAGKVYLSRILRAVEQGA